MESEKEQWIEGVFSSLEGASRAVPRSGLLEEIESELFSSEQDEGSVRMVGRLQSRIAVAAAVVLLAANVFAFTSMGQSQSQGPDGGSQRELADQSLISDYNLYH